LKIYPEKLSQALSAGLSPIYIVSGDEPLLVQECCDMIRLAARQADYSEREIFHVETGFDWQEFIYSANSLSLFADQKLLELRMSSAKPGNAGAGCLKEYAAKPSSANLLLLSLPRLDQATQKTQWFKALEKVAVFVQVWPVASKDLPRWIDARFKKVGLQATRDAVLSMAARVEGNLLAAAQEIDRIKLVSDSAKVEVDDVEEGVANSARFDVFQLLDAAMMGKASRCLKITDSLRNEGTEILYLSAMLAREVRSLVSMAEIMRGSSMEAAMQQGRVWQKRKPLVAACLQRHDLSALLKLQLRVNSIDPLVKGVQVGDPWAELTRTVLLLAGIVLPLPEVYPGRASSL
jgi:DNA polymerase-3 subunit delta